MHTQPRNRLTECLRCLEKEVALDWVGKYRFGPADEFTVRVANTTEDRLNAWALAYRVYREKEYAQPNAQGLWYSLFDALPGTVTVLVERRVVEGGGWKLEGQGSNWTDQSVAPSTLNPPPSTSLIGAVTVVPDSPLGLPADAVFAEEMQHLRQSGTRLAEAVSLVQAGLSERSGILVAAKLCEFTCLVAQRLLGATDLVITVNPRHEDYYRRVMLFERRGAEVPCDKVSGAPAVFLTLNFAEMQRHIERTELPDAPRTIYRRFMRPAEAGAVAGHLERQRRPLDEATLRRYFVEERPLLAEANAAQRAHVLGQYPIYDLGGQTFSLLAKAPS